MAQNMGYAGEYTPEITQNYLQSIQRPIQQAGAIGVGQARGAALRRGMAGDPFEALSVGAANNTMNTNLADANNNLAFNVAGQAQQERVGKEAQASNQAFTADQASQNRAFQEQMAATQNEYKKAMLRAKQNYQQDQFLPNLVGDVGGYVAGRGLAKVLGFGSSMGAMPGYDGSED